MPHAHHIESFRPFHHEDGVAQLVRDPNHLRPVYPLILPAERRVIAAKEAAFGAWRQQRGGYGAEFVGPYFKFKSIQL